ncbi:hypothetical protein [Mangrovicoccus sp. HB161399]|uniref:hypothetical protein n=1 Tax=Mangrovicoccus sp. HB161399 TaxID=2720392 RepID=UPI0015541829|nr:hypothetical protein [Mangrovicoccus sp. HB161399]
MTTCRLATATLVLGLAAGGAWSQDADDRPLLQAGAARLDITPPHDDRFPAMDEYEHEHLFLRAIAIGNGSARALLIGADLSGIDESVWGPMVAGLAEETGIPEENILISSTHTHSDWPLRQIVSGTPRWGTDFLAEKVLDVAGEALAAMEPAKVGFAEGEAHLNVNRDTIDPVTKAWTQAANLDAVSDPALGVIAFFGSGGAPIAAVANYAMHPVNGYLAGFTSADFPGAMSRHVETAFGDGMVTLFTQGASGDQNPRWLRTGTNALAARSGQEVTGFEMVREDIEAPIRTGEMPAGLVTADMAHELGDYMQALGVVLGEEAIRVMSHMELRDAARIEGRQAIVTCPGRTRLDNVREGAAGEYEDGPDVEIRVGMLGIGDIALLTTNAEVYTDIGLAVKARSPLSKAMYVTLANGKANSGYIPDDESFGHQTFQVLGSKLKPGCAGEAIPAAIAGLVGDYLSE